MLHLYLNTLFHFQIKLIFLCPKQIKFFILILFIKHPPFILSFHKCYLLKKNIFFKSKVLINNIKKSLLRNNLKYGYYEYW